MSEKIQAIRGMNDLLPDSLDCWQQLEKVSAEVFAQFGYREIRLPVIEKTELFARSIGQATDIVEKEMYTFQDRNGDSLTLRPEGTAGVVRAALQNGMLHNNTQRLWYCGPMFRHERPQKGRYRQFHQIGVEAFGMVEAELDAEIISMTSLLWQRLGLTDLTLEINSLGTVETRQRYRNALVDYYEQHRQHLDEDSVRRLASNPLRILDSKDPAVRDLNRRAPSILEYLDTESAEHLQQLETLLGELGVHYHLNPMLVRGLDYYTRTVFEWATDQLGAQSAVCGGGRYDGLVDKLGGKGGVPAAGFAIGMERLIELLQLQSLCEDAPAPDIYLVQDAQASVAGMRLAMELRRAGYRVVVNIGATGFKSQLKRADRSGASVALILGADELQRQAITIKQLASGEQTTVTSNELLSVLSSQLKPQR